MYNFLVTNDDGINSEGLHALVRSLSRLGKVYVVAPSGQQSAKSMAITFLAQVNASEADVQGAEQAYALTGTPADCTKWGLDHYEGEVDIDFIISGINRGYNLGTAQYYSGTVAAAREGALQGVRSIALSVESMEATHYEYICAMLPELLKMSEQLEPNTFLNVNAPNLPSWKVKGVRIVPAAPHEYGDVYHYTDKGDGNYQLGVSITELDESLDNDFNATTAGYAAITPYTVGNEDSYGLDMLRGFKLEDPVFVFIDAQTDVIETLDDATDWKNNISKWAHCVNRLDMPALVAELHGKGRTLGAIRNGIDRAERVERLKFNAMESKDFAQLIKGAVNKRVYIAGLETHVAVEQTALEMRNKGYDVVVIEDCCASAKDRDHAVAVDNMRYAGCRIATFESAVMELVGSTKHPAYKSIRRIIEE